MPSSISLLKEHNIKFDKFKEKGIDPVYFSYQFIQSGLLSNKQLTWVCFHGSYDMGYLVKYCTLHELPLSLSEFNLLRRQLFVNVVDLKTTLKWDSSL